MSTPFPAPVAIAALAASLASAGPSKAAFREATPLTPLQQAVWQGEVDYWKHVNARDLKSYLTLWHPDFTGWPCGAAGPANLEGLGRMAEKWFADMTSAGQVTTPQVEAVVVDDGFAITYLSARTTWTGADGGQRSKLEKFVHSWKATDHGWKIIGGMCAPLDTYPTAQQE